MFVLILTYKKPLEIIDQYVVEHRQYLDECYAQKIILISGPQIPRSGGIIILTVKTREQLQKFIEQDPFFIHDVADYQSIEFDPIKSQPQLMQLLKNMV